MTGPRVDSHADGGSGSLGGGRYILGEILGEGGMATVFRARDTRLGVTRAIKVLTPALAGKRRIEQRFENEARAMASLAHPAIVRVVDIAEEDGRPYIVMELLEGGTLWEWVEAHGPMPERMAVDALLPVLDAMEAAHAQGIVHRDLKPQNILLSSAGESRVTDFGIAHVTDPRGDNLTRTGTVMGTWGYMSPEQRNSARSVDARSDVYAIGATLAALVTARVPIDLFAADQDPSLLRGVSASLAMLIRRATRYGPDGRYQSAAEMGQALGDVRGQLEPTPPNAPPLGERRRSGVTAVPFEPASPAATPGTLAEFAPMTTGGVAHTTAPGPDDPARTAVPDDASLRTVAAPPDEELEPRATRVPAILLALAAGAALVGIASWAAIRPDTQPDPTEPPAAVAGDPTAPPAAPPAVVAPAEAPPTETPPTEPVVIPAGDAEARSAAEPPPPVREAPETVPAASPAGAAPDDGAGSGADGAEAPPDDAPPDKAAPAAIAPPPPPAPARVLASGDAEEVWLVAGATRVELGSVPAGSYGVMARFSGGEAAPAGQVELSPGEGVRLDCVSAFRKCKATR